MKRIIKTFKKYDLTMKTAANTLKEVAEKLKAEYSSKVFEEKYAEAKVVYDETVEEAKQEALQEISEVFKELNEKVKAFVQTPAPADFISTLECVKLLGADITEEEAKAFCEKFSNNYLAARSLTNYIHDLKGFFLPIPAYDRIKENMENMENEAKSFVNEYKSNSYVTALFTTDKENPWEVEAEKLQKFLGGYVGIIAEDIEKVAEA